MYDIRVIRENKNVLVNYINALHVFSKNLMGPLLEFMSKIKYFYQNYKREDFLKVRGMLFMRWKSTMF